MKAHTINVVIRYDDGSFGQGRRFYADSVQEALRQAKRLAPYISGKTEVEWWTLTDGIEKQCWVEYRPAHWLTADGLTTMTQASAW